MATLWFAALFLLHAVSFAEGEFLHGVASGTPQPSSVIIWTRVTPDNATVESVKVYWRVSTSNDLTVTDLWVSHGSFVTNADRDFTVKVTVTDLSPYTQYFYGFSTDDAVSDVGVTLTAPLSGQDTSSSTFGLFSCSNWRNGYFHAYNLAASADTLDFWLFVGDFIYELSDYEYPPKGTGARETLSPSHEAISLSDYRARYAQYRTDVNLQTISRRAPMIVIWDDHEFADNADIRGAENHQPVCYDLEGRRPTDPGFTPINCDQDEGDWQTRVNAATRAFHEWLPIPDRGSFDNDQDRRDIRTVTNWGNLMTLFGTDDRINARTCVANCGGDWYEVLPIVFNETRKEVYDDPSSQLNAELDAAYQKVLDVQNNASNVMLTTSDLEALQFVFQSSKVAGVTWQIFLSQIIFSPQQHPDFYTSVTLYPDYTDTATFILDIVFRLNSVGTPTYSFPVNDQGMLFRGSYASVARKFSISGDQWDGYTHQRRQMLELFQQVTNNLVVLSGDSHNAWAFDLEVDGFPVGVEFAGTSVSSAGYETASVPLWEFFGGVGFQMWRSAWYVSNPPLKYTNPIDRGFTLIRATSSEMVAEYYFLGSDVAPDYRSDSYPYGSQGVANATWNGEYYCEGVKTVAGSKKVTTNVTCGVKFGNGLDSLDGAVNVYGSDAHVITFSIGSAILSAVLFLCL